MVAMLLLLVVGSRQKQQKTRKRASSASEWVTGCCVQPSGLCRGAQLACSDEAGCRAACKAKYPACRGIYGISGLFMELTCSEMVDNPTPRACVSLLSTQARPIAVFGAMPAYKIDESTSWWQACMARTGDRTSACTRQHRGRYCNSAKGRADKLGRKTALFAREEDAKFCYRNEAEIVANATNSWPVPIYRPPVKCLSRVNNNGTWACVVQDKEAWCRRILDEVMMRPQPMLARFRAAEDRRFCMQYDTFGAFHAIQSNTPSGSDTAPAMLTGVCGAFRMGAMGGVMSSVPLG